MSITSPKLTLLENTQAASTPIERVIAATGASEKAYKDWYSAKCTGHPDRSASLSFIENKYGGVNFKCHAGCSRESILQGMNLSEEDVSTTKGYRPRTKPEPALDLITLAAEKLLPWKFIFNQGVSDDYLYRGKLSVRIPYYTKDGEEHGKIRVRYALSAKEGSKWDGDDSHLIAYGLHKLQEARDKKYLLIGEGESDAWTCWLYGVPYLGVPGASNYACLNGSDLNGIDRIFIIQEPDSAGKKFTNDVLQRLRQTRYKGKLYVLPFQPYTGQKDPNDLHKSLLKEKQTKQFTEILSAAIEKVTNEQTPIQAKPKTERLIDLQQEILPDTVFTIPDLLPEGLALLAGKPKLGKSWLLLAMLLGVAAGSVVMGNIPVEQAEVLYISLEDNKKRLQKRSNLVLRQAQASRDFHYATTWARLDEGGIEDLEEWIQEHPRVRLIGIDTWARIKPRNKGGASKQQYDEDYDALTPLQELASKYHVSIVLVHHLRKQESEDPLDMISGSTAMQGAVDGFLMLYRKRGEMDARLMVVGRDVEEDQELLLTFNQECATWTIKGNADEVAGTPERQAILDLMKHYPNGLPLKEIATRLDKNPNTIRNLILSLRNENKMVLTNNIYSLVSSSKPSIHSKPSNPSKLDENTVTTQAHTVTTPYYGVRQDVVTPSNPVEQPGKPREAPTTEPAYYGYYANYRNALPEEQKKKIDRLYERMIAKNQRSTFYSVQSKYDFGSIARDVYLDRAVDLLINGSLGEKYDIEEDIDKRLGRLA